MSPGTGGGSPGSGGASGTSGETGAGGLLGSGGALDEPVDAVTLAAGMGFGVNIGNTLENTSIWETGWGQPPITQEFIQGMAASGIDTVRIPVAWDTYATAGTIDPAHLARVQEVVDWVEAAGMYAIVNIHWDGGWIFGEGTADEYELTAAVKAKFASYWQQIAAGFAQVGHRLVLEGLNEEARFYVGGNPDGQPDYAALNELNQLFVTTVRASAGYNASRGLLIAGFQTDFALTCVDAFDVPSDPAGPGKLLLSLHYYTPYTFTLMDTVESWGSPATTWGSTAEVAELNQLFDLAGDFAQSQGLPVILGEFAVTRGENYPRQAASRILWLKSVTSAARERGMVPVLWDTGSEVDRQDGSISSELGTVLDELDLD